MSDSTVFCSQSNIFSWIISFYAAWVGSPIHLGKLCDLSLDRFLLITDQPKTLIDGVLTVPKAFRHNIEKYDFYRNILTNTCFYDTIQTDTNTVCQSGSRIQINHDITTRGGCHACISGSYPNHGRRCKKNTILHRQLHPQTSIEPSQHNNHIYQEGQSELRW